MAASKAERTARYLSTPRQCVDCGQEPMAGHLRCKPCQLTYAAGGVDIGPALREDSDE